MNLESLETRTARPLTLQRTRRGVDHEGSIINDHQVDGARLRCGTKLQTNLQDRLWPLKNARPVRGKEFAVGGKHHRSASETMTPKNASARMSESDFSAQCGASTARGGYHKRTSAIHRPPSSSTESYAPPTSLPKSALNIMAPAPTQSIPIDKESMKRTDSEVKLVEDEAVAEYRDYVMYHRILTGMIQDQHSYSYCAEGSFESSSNLDTVRHIIETRQRPVESPPSSYTRESWMKYAGFTSHPSSSRHPFHQSAPNLMGGEAPPCEPEFSSLPFFNDEDHDRGDDGVFMMDDV